MSKQDDIKELTQIAEHLEEFANAAEKQYTGYCHAALEIASQAVFHAVDQLHTATNMLQTEADLGAQRQPSSVAKIQAETKAVAKELENVGTSAQHQADGDIWQDVYSGQHPADREPTDEEVERACEGYSPSHKTHPMWCQYTSRSVALAWLKAWQQVWREAK